MSKLDSKTVKEAFAHDDTPAIVLFAIVCKAYPWILPAGDNPDHEPVDAITIWTSLRHDFGIVTSVEAENKIMAMLTAVETDLYYDNPEMFKSITGAICHGDVDDVISGSLGDISGVEASIAIHEIDLVRGEEHPEYAPAVQEIINRELKEEANDDEDGADLQEVLQRHDGEIKDWLKRLGLSET